MLILLDIQKCINLSLLLYLTNNLFIKIKYMNDKFKYHQN